MAESKIELMVPTELNNLSIVAQSFVKELRGGKKWLAALGDALPVLFAEGVKFDDLKEEIKSPRAIALAGLVVGEMIALFIEKKVEAAASEIAPAAQA